PAKLAPVLAATNSEGGGGSAVRDAVSALVNLGYAQAQAATAIAMAARELDEGAKTQALIRVGLKELAR
ncbi:MAG: Holliday junction branch migration protein RuvA, partial [Rhodobiaceae bacterium]|nr:Holliday junction branch migration protein RuvA [Rhodobiaceae bacterium]